MVGESWMTKKLQSETEFKIFFLMFIFERDRERAGKGQRERGGDTESEAGSELSAQNLTQG